MLCGCTVNSLNECRRICTGLPVGLTPVQSHTCAAACRSGRSLRKHLLLKLQRPLADERAGSVKVSKLLPGLVPSLEHFFLGFLARCLRLPRSRISGESVPLLRVSG